MLDFIAKYWLEILFGALIAGITAIMKHYVGLIRADFKRQSDDAFEQIKNEILTHHNEDMTQLSQTTDAIKNGVLSIQGKEFKQECRDLLQCDHEITIEEYEQFEKDHDAYNSLGGNHEGDHLYELVKRKVEGIITQKKEDTQH